MDTDGHTCTATNAGTINEQQGADNDSYDLYNGINNIIIYNGNNNKETIEWFSATAAFGDHDFNDEFPLG